MKKYLSMLLVVLVLVSCQSVDKSDKPSADTGINYRSHIVVKGGDETHVIYEYSDVRIDDVASLAIEYCKRKNPQYQANLRDIYMYKNHKRRATFDCTYIAQQ